MKSKLEQLIIMFINKEIDINELQNKISTIKCDTRINQEKIKILDNKLEEILYCYNIENQYKEVIKFINYFLKDIL